jgi:peptidoglycan hydrolase CwlO-like protein
MEKPHMNITAQSALSALPAIAMLTGLIFSYATLSVQADDTAEDLDDTQMQVDENTERLRELDKQVSVMSNEISQIDENVDEVSDDVKLVLQLIRSKNERD